MIAVAGVGLWRHDEAALDLLALALITLLAMGLRNSWDMTLWNIDRRIE
jgi:hypothetical protein